MAVFAFLVTAWVITGMVARVRQLTEAQVTLRFEERLAERTRIARELHDTLLQSFQALMLHFQAVYDQLPAGKAKEALGKALDRADQAIVEGRSAESVRNQSKSLGVTRARVYQMLEECHNVMSIRWPDGRRQLDEFAQWLDESYASAEAANLMASLRELLYPLKFDAVAEHLRAEVS